MATKSKAFVPPEDAICLEYPKAPMSRRMIALLCDVACMLITGLACFYLIRLGLEQTSWYQGKYETFISISIASGLYVDDENVDENGLTTVLEYVEGATDADGNYIYSVSEQNAAVEEALTYFYRDEQGLFFSEPNEGDDDYAAYNVWKANREEYGDTNTGYGDYLYYVEKRDASTGDGDSYFVLREVDDIPTWTANSALDDDSMHDFYVSASDNSQQYLVYNDDYLFATRYLVIIVFLVALPTSIIIPALIFYFLIPLIFFRRGWQTLGMKPFHLYILNGEALSPRFRTFLFRFLWILFVEMLASILTFAIPLIISFSMQAFRKDGQSFHDYMTGTYMVDASEQSVYISKEEYWNLREKFRLSEEKNELLLQPNLRGNALKESTSVDKKENIKEKEKDNNS